jgi:uncharacterized membrane protein required for colicin V production
MKIDFKDPINSSVIGVVVIFSVSIIALSLMKPVYIMEITDTGLYKMNYILLIFYSLLYGILVGTIILFFMTRNKSIESNRPNPKMEFSTYNPAQNSHNY